MGGQNRRCRRCVRARGKAINKYQNSAATGRTKTKTCTNRTFRQVECSTIARDYQRFACICGDGEDDDEEETDSDEENDGFKADAQKLVHSVTTPTRSIGNELHEIFPRRRLGERRRRFR